GSCTSPPYYGQCRHRLRPGKSRGDTACFASGRSVGRSFGKHGVSAAYSERRSTHTTAQFRRDPATSGRNRPWWSLSVAAVYDRRQCRNCDIIRAHRAPLQKPPGTRVEMAFSRVVNSGPVKAGGTKDMGQIVAAFGTVHAPQLIIRPPDEDPQMLDASIAAMRELGKILDETKPDAIVFLGSDHLETFSMKCIPTFAIIGGKRAIA